MDGFKIDEEYTPARLYELAKMDGAIILSKDLKRILLANTQIVPSSKILSNLVLIFCSILSSIYI
mgnify:CR=1 FL=1